MKAYFVEETNFKSLGVVPPQDHVCWWLVCLISLRKVDGGRAACFKVAIVLTHAFGMKKGLWYAREVCHLKVQVWKINVSAEFETLFVLSHSLSFLFPVFIVLK